LSEVAPLTVNPVRENIVNRIAPGSIQTGTYRCEGGLWVQGRIEGDIEVHGTLILSEGGEMLGNIRVFGERAVLAGSILARSADECSEVEIHGLAELCESLKAKANIAAAHFEFFRGADVEGKIRTLRPGE